MSDRGENINYRQQFRTFLLKEGFSEYGSDIFLGHLSSIVDFFIKSLSNQNHRTVFEISNVELLTEYYSILMEDPVFVKINRSKEKRPGSALLKYIEFAKSLNTIQQQSITKVSITESLKTEKNILFSPDSTNKAKLTKTSLQQTYTRNILFILQPIDEYLIEYQLSTLVSFEYLSAFRDVTITQPCFKVDLDAEARELEELVSLMTKYDLSIPTSIHKRLEQTKEQKELRDAIRSFENWLVSYIVYLKSETLEVESIIYSPHTGYTINLTGKDVTPTRIRMKTKGAKTVVGIINKRRSK